MAILSSTPDIRGRDLTTLIHAARTESGKIYGVGKPALVAAGFAEKRGGGNFSVFITDAGREIAGEWEAYKADREEAGAGPGSDVPFPAFEDWREQQRAAERQAAEPVEDDDEPGVRRMKSDEVRKNWADAMAFVKDGGEVIIERYNTPIAKLAPYAERPSQVQERFFWRLAGMLDDLDPYEGEDEDFGLFLVAPLGGGRWARVGMDRYGLVSVQEASDRTGHMVGRSLSGAESHLGPADVARIIRAARA